VTNNGVIGPSHIPSLTLAEFSLLLNQSSLDGRSCGCKVGTTLRTSQGDARPLIKLVRVFGRFNERVSRMASSHGLSLSHLDSLLCQREFATVHGQVIVMCGGRNHRAITRRGPRGAFAVGVSRSVRVRSAGGVIGARCDDGLVATCLSASPRPELLE
jgi:hypothetical protein